MYVYMCVWYRVSLAKRVEYADDMMHHIMDSADNPMQVHVHVYRYNARVYMKSNTAHMEGLTVGLPYEYTIHWQIYTRLKQTSQYYMHIHVGVIGINMERTCMYAH